MILQLDSRVLVAAVIEAQHQLIKSLVYILRFEALFECPIVGRNGRDVTHVSKLQTRAGSFQEPSKHFYKSFEDQFCCHPAASRSATDLHRI